MNEHDQMLKGIGNTTLGPLPHILRILLLRPAEEGLDAPRILALAGRERLLQPVPFLRTLPLLVGGEARSGGTIFCSHEGLPKGL